jgi:CheY-like chemotaxis protein
MDKLILVVDDNKQVLDSIQLMLEDDFDVILKDCKEDALAVLGLAMPDAIFIDIEFGGVPVGFEIFEEIRARNASAKIILMSAESAYAQSPKAQSADGFLVKPFGRRDIDKLFKQLKLL